LFLFGLIACLFGRLYTAARRDFFFLLEKKTLFLSPGLTFQWLCHTFNTATFQELVVISALPLPDSFDTDCDVISSEMSPGIRRLDVAEGVSAVGYLFQVGKTLERLNTAKHVICSHKLFNKNIAHITVTIASYHMFSPGYVPEIA
jgi:hypothetical protein